MGQKVQPNGMRLGITRDWSACWYAKGKHYADKLIADMKVRNYIDKVLPNTSINEVRIERSSGNTTATISTARPGMVIGRKGGDIEKLKHDLSKLDGTQVQINIQEIRKPEKEASLIAENICQQLEKRIMFRRAMKRAVQNAVRSGALGIKVRVAGRLNGAEIARAEWYLEGRVPLHTLRADIDYGFRDVTTTYGVIGVKVWVFRGEKAIGLRRNETSTKDTAPSKSAKAN